MKKLFTLKALQHVVSAITALVLLGILYILLPTTVFAQNMVSPAVTAAATTVASASASSAIVATTVRSTPTLASLLPGQRATKSSSLSSRVPGIRKKAGRTSNLPVSPRSGQVRSGLLLGRSLGP